MSRWLNSVTGGLIAKPDAPLTIGQLRAQLQRARRLGGAGGMSRCNPSLTQDQALDIFEAAIRERPDDQVVNSPRDALLVRNIERELGYGR